MSDGYEYDIFLSFPRAGGTFAWVRNHFHPVLVETLTNVVGDPPQIFLYTDQENGLAWTANIKRSLQRSRYMVAVWGPTYFRSAWCRAELESIRRREQLLGMRTVEDPRGLVYPVIYVNSTNLPEEARAIFSKSTADLSDWAVPMPQFKDTPDFLQFYKAMRTVAEELRDLLPQAPPWQEDWPVVTPDENGSRKPPSVKPRM